MKRLLWVTVLTGVTMVAEFVGAYFTNSLALLGDAFHMLTHFGSVGMSYLAIMIATRPAPPDKTYRYWRAEVIAGFLNALLLLPVAIYILYEAYHRWQNPEEIHVGPMLGVATIGLVVNIVCAKALHHHSEHNINVRAAFMHMLADTLSSVGVIAAGVLILLTGWKMADPLSAALISILIFFWSFGLIRESVAILLESAPAHMDLEEIRASMVNERGVKAIHDLHVWTITSKMYTLTAHVILSEDLPVSATEDLAKRLETLLDGEYDINHVTLQFETSHEEQDCAHDDQETSRIPRLDS